MDGQSHVWDRLVAAPATTQHGVVAFGQLIELGLSADAVDNRVRAGRLHRVHRGVFAVGHDNLSRRGQLMAAALAYGPHALLGHWSAAELWGFTNMARPIIDVVAAADRRSREGIAYHQIGHLRAEDRTRRHGIPVTAVPRTLLDLASVAQRRQLAHAVDEAERAGWLNRRAVTELIERSRGRKGVRALQKAVAGPSVRRTRSDLEARFLRLLRTRGIDAPVVNANLEGFEVDFFWPSARLVVELDGYEYHRTRPAFERDRRRDAHLERKGYTVIRVSYEWLVEDPDGVTATVRELLARD
jgi:very-short-patch-repair endonuclease